MLSMPGRRLAAALTAVAAVALTVPGAFSSAAGPAPGQRVDLKVLILAATGSEAAVGGWKAALEREGVPYDVKVADAEAPFTDASFADYGANRARYQAVILASGDLLHPVANADGSTSFLTALSDAEWAALAKFERTFGIRQISDSTFPSQSHGMNPPAAVGADQGGATAQLTAAGLAAFPYLKGPVPIDAGAFGYRSTPAGAAFQTLLTGPDNAAYLGIYTHPEDGREEMVMTVDSNQNQTHNTLLRHGMLGWVTRGVYLGYQRNYFEMHIDDIFLPDDRWSADLNRTLVDGPTSAADELQCDTDPATTTIPDCRPIRMNATTDLQRLLSWQSANGLVLDLVYNGDGSEEAVRTTGSDPLATALLAQRSAFRWINHTFTHPNLDASPLATLTQEIGENIRWGQQKGLAIDPAELVTGEHSGLHNPAMPAALTQTGIRWIASDNSREPQPYTVGPATTVPRYPSNVYYNVATQAEQLDEYNYIYRLPPAGRCVTSATNTCRTTDATWPEYVASEATIMFRHLMGNDPRPHYAHQSNLAEEGVLYAVMDAVIARYRAAFKPNLVQLTQRQTSETLSRAAKWAADLAAGRVSAYLLDGQVHFDVTQTMEVPVTGTAAGEDYGGTRAGWIAVSPQAPPVLQPRTPGAPAGATRPSTSSSSSATSRPSAPAPAVGGGRRTLVLNELVMRPRRFTVAHRSAQRRRKPDGATLTWRLNGQASVRFSISRRSGRRYRPVGTITRRAAAGRGTLRFTGRIGTRPLRPGRYRLSVTATAPDGLRSTTRSLTFTVRKG